jgi:hypothetical protein
VLGTRASQYHSKPAIVLTLEYVLTTTTLITWISPPVWMASSTPFPPVRGLTLQFTFNHLGGTNGWQQGTELLVVLPLYTNAMSMLKPFQLGWLYQTKVQKTADIKPQIEESGSKAKPPQEVKVFKRKIEYLPLPAFLVPTVDVISTRLKGSTRTSSRPDHGYQIACKDRGGALHLGTAYPLVALRIRRSHAHPTKRRLPSRKRR